jgi:8-oxo-dGTP pyrophosphatase MutT (NUDIX family)
MNVISQKALRVLHFVTLPLSGHILHNSLRNRTVAICKNEVLLVKTSFGKQKWSFPGGGVHKGENPEHAATRELREETGVVIDSGDLVRIGEMRLPKNKKWPVANIRFYKLKFSEKPKVSISRPLEIMEIGWFSIDSLPEVRSETVDEGLKLI